MRTERLLKELGRREGAPNDLIERVEHDLRIKLPSDYTDFLKRSNGTEGPISDSYIVLWPVDELKTANDEYAVEEFAPGLLLFGSDGGDTAYAFDTTDKMAIVEVPFIGMGRDEVRVIAPTFSMFVDRLSATADE